MGLKIVVDTMGGDYNIPQMNIEGSIQALRELNFLEIILVGPQKIIVENLAKYKNLSKSIIDRVKIVNAEDVISMEDQPSKVLRTKPNSSIAVGIRLVKDNQADAFVSAGNSGAIIAFALTQIGTIEGINRPAITTTLPTLKGPVVLIDAGANVDCKPYQLVEFAYVGVAFYKCLSGNNNPTVGLLSIGTEESKGNSQTLATFELLKKTNLNFVGNIEGKDIPLGNVNVIVCDGFVGNIILKFGEGVAEMLLTLVKKSLKAHPVAFISLPFVWNAIKDLRKQVDFSEYGGAPLLGLRKPCVICHGRSDAKAIKNAIKTAKLIIEKDINSIIMEYTRYL